MKVIYIDDEFAAGETFKNISANIQDIEIQGVFYNPIEALEYVKEGNHIDVAFIDVEMPQMSGIEVAKQLKEINRNIKVVFITAYANFALVAFEVDAIGYLLKPYNEERLSKEIDKAKLILNVPEKKVFIRTMPYFDVYVDGKLLHIQGKKQKELLALLVDRNGGAITPGQAIACLWEDRLNDEQTSALYRMTYKRLRELLLKEGIEHIMGSKGMERFIIPSSFECDYFSLLTCNKNALDNFAGDYMNEYSWAEETKARLINHVSKYSSKK